MLGFVVQAREDQEILQIDGAVTIEVKPRIPCAERLRQEDKVPEVDHVVIVEIDVGSGLRQCGRYQDTDREHPDQ